MALKSLYSDPPHVTVGFVPVCAGLGHNILCLSVFLVPPALRLPRSPWKTNNVACSFFCVFPAPHMVLACNRAPPPPPARENRKQTGVSGVGVG